MRWVPQRFNDTLALLLILGIPLLWVVGGLSDIVLGATISVWTLVAQYYFRKKPGEEEGSGGNAPLEPRG